MTTDHARLAAYHAVFATLGAYRRDAPTCALVWHAVHAALTAYAESLTRPYTYLWWTPGESRIGPTFPPLEPDHAYYSAPCVHPQCFEPLGDGSLVTLLVIGPDHGDADDVEQHTGGRPYAALAVPTHVRCIGGDRP